MVAPLLHWGFTYMKWSQQAFYFFSYAKAMRPILSPLGLLPTHQDMISGPGCSKQSLIGRGIAA